MKFLFAASLVLATTLSQAATLPPAPAQWGLNGNEPDTTRRIAAVALGEVNVRPGKAAVLSSTPDKGTRMARRVLPGQSIAVDMRPASGEACQLNTLNFFLMESAKEGRIRVQLVTATVDNQGGRTPGTTALLANPVIISQQQLQDAGRGRVAVDLSAYNVLMPAEGLYVVMDVLASNPADLPVAVSRPANGKGERLMVLATDPSDMKTAHTVPADDFPALSGFRGVGAPTWSRTAQKPAWFLNGGANTNVRVELGVVVN